MQQPRDPLLGAGREGTQWEEWLVLREPGSGMYTGSSVGAGQVGQEVCV